MRVRLWIAVAGLGLVTAIACGWRVVDLAEFDFTTYNGVLAALTPGSDTSLIVRVTQPGGPMYGMLSGDRNQKAGLIYDWVVNSKAAQ